MLTIILNKLLLLAFIFCCLVVFRELFVFFTAMFTDGKYSISEKRAFGIGISLSFILMSIITGIFI